MAGDWEQLAAEAHQRRDASIAKVDIDLSALEAAKDLPRDVTGIPKTILSAEDVQLTETPFTKLIEQLASGQVSSERLTTAFLKRAAIAQKLTNCVIELVPDEALARAKELDSYLKQNGRVVGPLHGLPISIKARVHWGGRRGNEGFLANTREPYPEDSPAIANIKALGGVPFVRTTEPQGLLMMEAASNIHGHTANPHNTALTCGGSSGGEGALLGLHGSPLGLGGDVGGSLRSPAAFNGIYTLKPTAGRLPPDGPSTYQNGSEAVHATPGPMSPWPEAIQYFMKAALDTKPWETDPGLSIVPWRDLGENPFGDTINVAVMWDDGWVKPSKAVTRTLTQVVDRLRANPKFKVTDFEPYKTKEALDVVFRLHTPDGGESFEQALARSGEPFMDLTAWRIRDHPDREKLDIHGLWKWTVRREQFRAEFFNEWRTKHPDVHVLLMPVHQGAPQAINTTRYWGYTTLFNLLNYPVGVFPAGRVDPALDVEEPNYQPRNEDDAYAHAHMDAQLQANAPIGLQVVGKRMEDELVLRAMQEIVKATQTPS